MTIEQMTESFGKYRKSDPNFRPDKNRFLDLNGMLLLAELDPACDRHKMIGCAEHDQVWFSVDSGRVAENIMEEQINILAACGIFFDDDVDAFSAFV